MPEGTYNAWTGPGRIVEDPRHAVRLADSDEWLGGDLKGVGVEEAADYLLHRTRGVSLAELNEHYAENGRPDVILEARVQSENNTQRFTWDDEEEDYVPVDG